MEELNKYCSTYESFQWLCQKLDEVEMKTEWYRDKISVYLQRHPRAGEDTHLTSTQELVKIHNMCEDILI